MIKNFHYRFLLVVTFITGFLFASSVPEESNIISWMILGATFFFLGWITYRNFKKLSKESINEILFIDTLNKFGINLDEE